MQKGNPSFTEFKHLSKDAWLQQVEKELKGKAYKDLFWSTEEGITLEPYYTIDDPIQPLPIPPKVAQGEANKWVIRQKFWHNHLQQHVLKALAHGVEGIEVFDPIRQINPNELDGVHIQMVELNGSSIGHTSDWNLVRNLCESRGLSPEEISGSLTLDVADIRGTEQDKINQLRDWEKTAADFKNMRTVGIDASRYAACGANAVTELAIALSKGHATLLALLNDQSIDELAGSFEVKLSTGLSFLKDIAKLRAFRYLWFKMMNAYNPAHQCSGLVWIHTETTSVNQNIKDPYVNLIRGTVGAMAAVLGGTDSLTVKPHDYLTGSNSKEGLRWARNIQHILLEESGLDHVIDPSNGSWYIENLTYQLAQKAWEQFCEWEENGGYFSCENELIPNAVKRDRDALIHQVEQDERVILGVNKYKAPTDASELSPNWTLLEQYIPEILNLSREFENRKPQLT